MQDQWCLDECGVCGGDGSSCGGDGGGIGGIPSNGTMMVIVSLIILTYIKIVVL